jgi:hypothetical protein
LSSYFSQKMVKRSEVGHSTRRDQMRNYKILI